VTTQLSKYSKKELAELALADKAFFAQYILGFDCPDHQKQWYREFEIAKQEKKWLLILAPVSHGKSKCMAVSVPLQEIARNRDIRIGVISAQDDLAQDIMREIEAHLSGNPYMIESFGPFKPEIPKKWTLTGNPAALSVIDSGIHPKDNTVTSAGAGTSLLGRRFDLLILDDFLDDKNTATPARMKKISRWFYGVLRTRLAPDGMVAGIGTIQAEGDLYSKFMKDPRFKVIVQRAIIDDIKKEVLWPKEWPYETLSTLRDQEYETFMQFYQNQLLPQSSVLSTTAKVKGCFDYNRTFVNALGDPDRRSFERVVVGVDPNVITSRRSKYAVIMVIGIKGPDHIILNIIHERCYAQKLKEYIKMVNDLYTPDRFYIESNAFQNYLVQEMAEFIPTKGLFTSATKNDAVIGLSSIMYLIESGHLVIPAGDSASAHMAELFLNEILSYPNGQFSDILMAWYMAERGLKSFAPTALPVTGINLLRHGRRRALRIPHIPMRRRTQKFQPRIIGGLR